MHILRTRFILLPLLAAPTVCLTACKSASPAQPAPVTQPAPPVSAQTDDQLLRAHQADGLALALRVDGSSFHAGAQIPMRLLMEDFAARTPIAAGLCSGVSLTAEETTTHVSQTGDVDNPRCIGSVPSPDETPLPRGKVKTAEISQRNAANMDIAPGTYTLTVTWKALPVGKPTIVDRPPYTTVTSNPVQVTVTP